MAQINTRENTYKGIDHEDHHGMTMTGRIIRDAWVFGLLPEGDGFANKTVVNYSFLLRPSMLLGSLLVNCPAAYPPTWRSAMNAFTLRPLTAQSAWGGIRS